MSESLRRASPDPVVALYQRDVDRTLLRRNLALTPQQRPRLPFELDAQTLAAGLNFTLTTSAGDIDLLGEITGVHGMNKEELLSAIKAEKGIVEEGKAAKTVNMRELKQKVKDLRALKAEAYEAGESNKKINVLRRRMNRLKKRTRKAA